METKWFVIIGLVVTGALYWFNQSTHSGDSGVKPAFVDATNGPANSGNEHGCKPDVNRRRDTEFRVHKKDIYLGDPRRGCRLTKTADVSSIAVAPAGEWRLAFVRFLKQGELPGESHTQLWLLDLETMTATLQVDGNQEDTTNGQRDLAFSNDGRFIYFLAESSATSNAIVEFDTLTKQTQFIAAGNRLQIIRRGNYENDIATEQHKYHDEGGSYEQAAIIDRKGNVLVHSERELETDEDFNTFVRTVEGAIQNTAPKRQPVADDIYSITYLKRSANGKAEGITIKRLGSLEVCELSLKSDAMAEAYLPKQIPIGYSVSSACVTEADAQRAVEQHRCTLLAKQEDGTLVDLVFPAYTYQCKGEPAWYDPVGWF